MNENIGKSQQFVNLDDFENFTCDCGSDEFIQITKIKKVPGLYMGAAGETILYPVPVLKCNKCSKEIDIKAEIKKVNSKSKTSPTSLII